MCGIHGYFSPSGLHADEAKALAARMGRAIAHRGPDDHGEWCDPARGIVLGHRRLSIIDLSEAGHQPMVSHSGRYCIVLNGEIYNFQSLRIDLEKDGYPFKGHSDTEVALACFEKFGIEGGVPRFVGMFAIAVWDAHENRLCLIRDRLGEKPLYYGRVGSQFAFASDLNALREMPQFSMRISRDAIGLLLQHYYIPEPRTIYEDVFKLPPGAILTVTPDNWQHPEPPIRYWSATDAALAGIANPLTLDDGDAIDALETLLRDTIKDKMISDVPLGAFLSGGIDSSTVVAMMQAESRDRVKTYSIGFHEAAFNEANEAQRVAQHLGTDHTELYVSPEETRAVIPKLPGLYAEPFADSSQIPTYLVSALAREHVTVALSGDGGDELFGGYVRYLLAEKLWTQHRRLPGPIRHLVGQIAGTFRPQQIDALMSVLRPVIPKRYRYKQFGTKVQKVASIFRSDDPLSVYRSLISMWERPSAVVIGAGDIDQLAELPDPLGDIDTFTSRMMLTDMLTYLPGDILAKVDRASMGVSLEVRVPFLDHRVIEHAWRVPLSQKVRESQGKWLLKQVLYRYVPREIIDRPKMGFGVPVDDWLRGPLRQWAGDLLNGSTLRNDGFFHAGVVQRTMQQHIDGQIDAGALLWPILMFQSWLDHYERSA